MSGMGAKSAHLSCTGATSWSPHTGTRWGEDTSGSAQARRAFATSMAPAIVHRTSAPVRNRWVLLTRPETFEGNGAPCDAPWAQFMLLDGLVWGMWRRRSIPDQTLTGAPNVAIPKNSG